MFAQKHALKLVMPSSVEWVLKAFIGLFAVASLCSCATPIDSGGTTHASSSSTSPTADTSSMGAECNAFSSTGAQLAGKITTYYSGGSMQGDRIRLRLTGLDSRFTNSSTSYVQFFRWTANANAVTNLDSTPLNFLIEKGTVNTLPISGVMTGLDNATLNTVRQNGAVPGTTAQEFFNNTIFVITGLDYSWSALKVVLYEGSTMVAQADVLLPIFAANPNTYAQAYPPLLSNMHPLASLRGKTYSENEWLTRTKANCF